jgi:hypothetical protein
MTHHCLKRRGAQCGVVRPCALAALLLMLAGCAIDYVDDDGVRHVIGLTSISIPPPDATTPTAGHVIDVTTVGVSITDMPEGGSVTLGYNRAVTAVINDNALVLGNPLTIGEYEDAAPFAPRAKVPAQNADCTACLRPDF